MRLVPVTGYKPGHKSLILNVNLLNFPLRAVSPGISLQFQGTMFALSLNLLFLRISHLVIDTCHTDSPIQHFMTNMKMISCIIFAHAPFTHP